MSTNQPIENIGKKVFDLKDPEAKKTLWAYVKEDLHKVYSGYKYPTHHRDISNPLFITAADIYHDAVDGAQSIEEALRAVPQNYQLITYSIQQFLEANGYFVPNLKQQNEPGRAVDQNSDISRLFVSVTEAAAILQRLRGSRQ